MALGDRICTLTISILEGSQGFHVVDVIEHGPITPPMGGRVVAALLIDPDPASAAAYDTAIGSEVGKVVRRP
jgi:hypothetical protein